MGDIVTGGLLAIAGLLAGSFLSYLTDRARWWREEAAVAGAMVADIYDLIWGDCAFKDLEVHLMKVRARLEALGVPEGLVDILDEEAKDCWTSAMASRDQAMEVGDDLLMGISYEKLNAFKKTVRNVNYLLRPASTYRPRITRWMVTAIRLRFARSAP